MDDKLDPESGPPSITNTTHENRGGMDGKDDQAQTIVDPLGIVIEKWPVPPILNHFGERTLYTLPLVNLKEGLQDRKAEEEAHTRREARIVGPWNNKTATMTEALIVADPAKGIKVDAGVVAKPFREEIKAKIQQLKAQGIEAPLLVGLLANKDPAAKKYAEWTGKACRADGLRYELRELADPIDVEDALIQANEDPQVHGIIVYYPIFGQEESFSGASQDDYLRDSVSYRCDVEGLCHTYRTNLYRNVRFLDADKRQKCLLPCTALSVVKILEHCPECYDKSQPIGKHMTGKTVTVINRSEIVGRPLAAMLSNDGAQVYSIDINSIYRFSGGRLYKCEDETPESCVRKSSVVVTGVPTKAYRLPTEWIQPNTTVINVASFKNVDEDELLKIPGVVYVPLVGKVTVAMLERNLMRLFDQFHHPDVARGTQPEQAPWYGHAVQLYTAVAVTALLAMELLRK